MEKTFITLILNILKAATPEIRAELCKMLDALEQKAKQTPNMADDLMVWILKELLACK